MKTQIPNALPKDFAAFNVLVLFMPFSHCGGTIFDPMVPMSPWKRQIKCDHIIVAKVVREMLPGAGLAPKFSTIPTATPLHVIHPALHDKL
ncbi:hypothetical protein IV203_003309 [Nitzschia inconspicua]|uniref:Uncharacterized protein n=1 Tax=Nitzschia inconspicua TaxID=303405 RepID=A0A9K3PNL0_9STRA|nr:hypothetical protein IV203_003309 [Nitzschia inconspicua]